MSESLDDGIDLDQHGGTDGCPHLHHGGRRRVSAEGLTMRGAAAPPARSRTSSELPTRSNGRRQRLRGERPPQAKDIAAAKDLAGQRRGKGSVIRGAHAWNLRTSLAMAPGSERTRTLRPASSNVSERTRAVSYTSP